MNKLYRPFLGLMFAGAVFFIVKSLQTPINWYAVDFTYGVIMISILLSEFNSSYSHRSIKQTLTAPLSMFLMLYTPMFIVYVSVFIYLTISRFISRSKKNSSEPIFTEKFLFNISKAIILLSISHDWIKNFEIEPSFTFIMVLVIWVFFYKIFNSVLTYFVISLYENKNQFNLTVFHNFLPFTFSYLLILVALVFSYHAYNTFGLIVACFFIIQTQGTVLTNLTSKELNDRLSIDKLTGAFNRNYFDEVIELKLTQKNGFSILFVDLDDFKAVNDQYGHIIGDELLIDFVAILKSILRRENKLFRYGGDEFCIVFDKRDQAVGFQQRLEDFIFMFHEIKTDEMIYYHISLGIYEYQTNQEITYVDLIHQVDQNMYADKRRKKMTRPDALNEEDALNEVDLAMENI